MALTMENLLLVYTNEAGITRNSRIEAIFKRAASFSRNTPKGTLVGSVCPKFL